MSNVKFNDNGMFSIEVIPNGETTPIAQVNGRTHALPFLPQRILLIQSFIKWQYDAICRIK